jgi:hypothetical protein
MFASTSKPDDDGLQASYNISLLIAKSGKPHTIGEQLIFPAIGEVLKAVLHKTANDILKRIPLSNNTVQRRIDEMSDDVESFLCNYLQTTHFSIQLDESTLPVMNQESHEELLFARTLTTDTKDESIFNILRDYLMENSDPFIKYNASSSRWSTCHVWALSWFYKPFKTKCTRGVCNSLRHPSTTFSC